MPTFILLPATGTDADAPVFATAIAAARPFGSHLAFLHIRPDVHHDLAAVAAGDVAIGGGLDAVLVERETAADRMEHAAEDAWRAFCVAEGIRLAETPAEPGVTAEWLSEVGSEAAWLVAHGRAADLIVMGRVREGGVALELLEAALLDTGRPVLIAPDNLTSPLTDCVTIAWKDTREAAVGVGAALPFIRRARRVVILTVEEPADARAGSAARLARSLRWCTAAVTVQRLSRNGRTPVAALLQAATAAGSTLLVMGGYGHARLREAMFGGFTRAILEHAPLPVLLAH